MTIEVLGSPAPKGSGRAIMIAGKARHVPSGSSANQRALRSWDGAVRQAAVDAIGAVAAPPFVGLPLRVTMAFRLARPAGHWGAKGIKPSAPPYPSSRPDVDKLFRSTGDSLKGIVFDDDSRIVSAAIDKTWALPGQEGATITIHLAGAK